MVRYLLQNPWVLRGFANQPQVLLDPTGSQKNPIRPMNRPLWEALLQCDGKAELEESRVLRVLERHGLVAPVPEKNPGLSREQAYRLLPFSWKPTVQFSITGRCNLNCLHCFMAAGQTRSRENDDMSRAQLLQIVDQLPACGVCQVELTGGEPLCSPHFRTVVERLSLRHVEVSRILTNGLLVDDALFDFLEAQGQRPEIVISFDGLGTHNWQRNHPEAEQNALAAMDLTVKRGFDLRCAVQVNRHTLPRLLETCRFLREKGAGSLFLIRTLETPRWAENAWVDESLPFTDYYEACCQVAEAIVREGWRTDLQVFNGFTLYCDPQPKLAKMPPCSGSDSCALRCGRAAASFFISHTGQVWPCDAFEGIGQAGGFFDGATLQNSSLQELLDHSAYARAMAITLNDIWAANEDCRKCGYFPQCGGGCRAVGYGSSMYHEEGYALGQGRLDKKAYTTCTYYRGGYAQRMEALVNQALYT